MKNFFRGLAFWLLFIIILTALLQQMNKKQEVRDLPYSTFKQMIKDDRVIKVVIDTKNNGISGKFYDESRNDEQWVSRCKRL